MIRICTFNTKYILKEKTSINQFTLKWPHIINYKTFQNLWFNYDHNYNHTNPWLFCQWLFKIMYYFHRIKLTIYLLHVFKISTNTHAVKPKVVLFLTRLTACHMTGRHQLKHSIYSNNTHTQCIVRQLQGPALNVDCCDITNKAKQMTIKKKICKKHYCVNYGRLGQNLNDVKIIC